jgi:hypothetical protein
MNENLTYFDKSARSLIQTRRGFLIYVIFTACRSQPSQSGSNERSNLHNTLARMRETLESANLWKVSIEIY